MGWTFLGDVRALRVALLAIFFYSAAAKFRIRSSSYIPSRLAVPGRRLGSRYHRAAMQVNQPRGCTARGESVQNTGAQAAEVAAITAKDFTQETSSVVGAYAGTVGLMAFTNIEGYQGEIFCNRNMNMKGISAVGFDMDYTLALYRPDTFEKLVYKEALKRLVNKKGYPSSILGYEYDPTYYVRGLHVDKNRGNILKLDRHKYVKVAYHGFEKLSKEERMELYSNARHEFTEPDFQCLDTLFSLPEAYLFSQMIAVKDSGEELQDKSFFEIWRDVRHSVDACHWSHEHLKKEVAKDPAQYIVRDPHLFESLRHLKRSGRKLFLLTNSFWEYTNVVMNYLWGNPPGVIDSQWQDIFDVIIAGSCKPGFFVNNRLQLYRVQNPQENRAALDIVDGLPDLSAKELLQEGKIFQGGNWENLHKMLEISSGSEILYVGDHMYSDVIRSKRDLGWRTMMVIPELLHEIDRMESPLAQREFKAIRELYFQRACKEDDINELSVKLADMEERGQDDEEGATQEDYRDALELVSEQLFETKTELRERIKSYHEMFHPIWGQLFKTGLQNSIFAQHVEKYACLYTSHASNFRFVSPSCSFRCMADLLPHDGLRRTVANPNARDRASTEP
uniref:5'-nucleotidase n=1 Tax=Lotharella globosa TaxID=91324 RepID=A0A7S3Z779_9EUKA